MGKICVSFEDGVHVTISLRADATQSVARLLSSVPFTSSANTWGDEVYFEAPFHAELEQGARLEMDVGEVAFWPDGDAIAIFFGPTPASKGTKPRAYSPCNILGRIEGDASVLGRVKPGTSLMVEPG